MQSQESWFSRNSYLLFFLIPVIALTLFVVCGFIMADDGRKNIQKAIEYETNELNQVKDDCKTLGDWIIKNGNGPLNLDPVVNKAKNIYMVKCK